MHGLGDSGLWDVLKVMVIGGIFGWILSEVVIRLFNG